MAACGGQCSQSASLPCKTQMEGVIGEHMDCPIERLAITNDRTWLASASHDNVVKLWDISDMLSSTSDEVPLLAQSLTPAANSLGY